jgi:multidrug efflux system membrane fusion protein
VRPKVETLEKAIVVPASAVQRGPVGTFSYVIGPDNVATAKPVVVTQQNETEAVVASGLSTSDRVVTTGFANLSDGAKVLIGTDDRAPSADLAPRKRSRSPDAKGGQPGEGQGKEGRGKRGEGDQKGPTGSAPANGQAGGAAK